MHAPKVTVMLQYEYNLDPRTIIKCIVSCYSVNCQACIIVTGDKRSLLMTCRRILSQPKAAAYASVHTSQIQRRVDILTVYLLTTEVNSPHEFMIFILGGENFGARNTRPNLYPLRIF
jgi:hypothetical protein